MEKFVNIFAYRGFVGIAVNGFTVDDDGNFTSLPDCFLNDPLKPSQMGMIANGAAVVISQEAFDLLSGAEQDDGGLPTFFVYERNDDDPEDMPFVVGWLGFVRSYLDLSEPIGPCNLDLLKQAIGGVEVDKDFKTMIDAGMAADADAIGEVAL